MTDDARPVIREAVDGDARAIAELARESAEAHTGMSSRFYRVPDQRDALRRAEQELAADDRTTLVAVVGSQIVGAVEMTPLPRPTVGSMVRDLRALDVGIVVTASHRGRGIGRALLEAAEERAARDGIELMTLTAWNANEGALGLYRSVGYQDVGVVMHRWIS
jgi:ribosomal protein S18 acetylase RimI-like enzyme